MRSIASRFFVLASLSVLATASCSKAETPSAHENPVPPVTSSPTTAATAPTQANTAPSAAASETPSSANGAASASASAAASVAAPTASAGAPAKKDGGPAAVASASASADAKPTCGDKPLPPCPLYAWMKANTSAAMSSQDMPALATALDKVVGFAPPGYANWASISRDGAKAARDNQIDGVKASCRGCHDQYKAKYKKEMRARPI